MFTTGRVVQGGFETAECFQSDTQAFALLPDDGSGGVLTAFVYRGAILTVSTPAYTTARESVSCACRRLLRTLRARVDPSVVNCVLFVRSRCNLQPSGL